MSWAGPVARLDPTLTACVVEGFMARLGFSMIAFALPFYALSLGMSVAEIGALAAFRAALMLTIKPLVGGVADRFGAKLTYSWSVAARGAVSLLLALATAPWMLFAVRGLDGMAMAARDPSSALLLADNTDPSRMARAFSWYQTARVLGGALGFPLAGVLLTLTQDNYALVFATAFLTSLLAWIAVVALAPNSVPRSDAGADVAADAASAVTPATGWLGYAGLALLVAVPASMINGLFPIIASQWSGVGKAELGTVLFVSQLLVAFAGPLMGWAADRVSRGLVLSVRSVANVLSSILYVAVPSLAGLVAARLTDDIGKAGFKPAWGSIMAEVARSGDARRRGRVIARLDTAESLGDAIGPLAAGLLWDWGGVVWLFAVRAGLSVVAEIYAIWLLHRVEGPRAFR